MSLINSLAKCAAVCAVSWGVSAHAISVSPAAPKAHDTVRVQVTADEIGTEWTTNGAEISMIGSRITLTYNSTGISNPARPTLDWPLGQFPAGTYQVDVMRRTGGVSTKVAETSFTVSQRTGNQPRANYSDMWWNPQESGWGISIQQHATDQTFVTWYTYDTAGRATWYVMSSVVWFTENGFDGVIYRTTGSPLGTAFNPNATIVSQAGTGRVTFNDFSNGTFTYSADGISGQKVIRRQQY